MEKKVFLIVESAYLPDGKSFNYFKPDYRDNLECFVCNGAEVAVTEFSRLRELALKRGWKIKDREFGFISFSHPDYDFIKELQIFEKDLF